MRCAPDATLTTRSRICGSSRLVSAKWPRWLVPICISKPSLVCDCGRAMTPALLTRMWRSPSHASANARTEERSARSSDRTSTVPGISLAARSPLAVSRTASVTRAPARASSRAAIFPMPELAPVTTTVRPSSLGRSCAVHFEELMRADSRPRAALARRGGRGARAVVMQRVEIGAVARCGLPLLGGLDRRSLAPLAERRDQLPGRARGDHVAHRAAEARDVARQARRRLGRQPEARRDREGAARERLLAARRGVLVPLLGL